MDNKKWIVLISTLVFSSTALARFTLAPSGILNWCGAYAGGFIGGAKGSHIVTHEPLRLDNNARWFRPFENSFHLHNSSSFIGGATIGYNWLMDCQYLMGLEGEYGYLNLHHRSVDPNQFPYAKLPNSNLINTSQSVVNIGKSFGYTLLGMRVGYTSDCVFFYFKSGAVFTKINSAYNSIKTEDNMPAFLNLAGSKRITGYAVGGGFEYDLSFEGFTNFSTKIEYLYFGFNKKLPVYGHCSCNFLWRTIEHIKGVNTIKVGIIYRFW